MVWIKKIVRWDFRQSWSCHVWSIIFVCPTSQVQQLLGTYWKRSTTNKPHADSWLVHTTWTNQQVAYEDTKTLDRNDSRSSNPTSGKAAQFALELLQTKMTDLSDLALVRVDSESAYQQWGWSRLSVGTCWFKWRKGKGAWMGKGGANFHFPWQYHIRDYKRKTINRSIRDGDWDGWWLLQISFEYLMALD